MARVNKSYKTAKTTKAKAVKVKVNNGNAIPKNVNVKYKTA